MNKDAFLHQLDNERHETWEDYKQAIELAEEANRRLKEALTAYEACEKFYEVYARKKRAVYERLPRLVMSSSLSAIFGSVEEKPQKQPPATKKSTVTAFLRTLNGTHLSFNDLFLRYPQTPMEISKHSFGNVLSRLKEDGLADQDESRRWYYTGDSGAVSEDTA